MELLFIDTETGGLDPNHSSLLSVGLVVWRDGKIYGEKELFVKESIIKASPEALSINKINLVEHSFKSFPPKVVVETMLAFCFENTFSSPPWVIAGHNIHFDISFLKPLFEHAGFQWSKYFSHRTVDTNSVLKFLFAVGVLNTEIFSSDEAFEYFHIPIKDRHTALSDAVSTAKLFTALIAFVNSNLKCVSP